MFLSVYLYLITLIVSIHQTVTVRYVSICIFILDYFDIHQTVTVRYVSIFILDYFDAIHQTVTVRYASIFILDYFDAIHQTVTVRYVSIYLYLHCSCFNDVTNLI